MIRAHFPPFDTVDPPRKQEEKKVEPVPEESYVGYKPNKHHHTVNYTPPTLPASYFSQVDKEKMLSIKQETNQDLFEKILLAILANPMTDVSNINKNVDLAFLYANNIRTRGNNI